MILLIGLNNCFEKKYPPIVIKISKIGNPTKVMKKIASIVYSKTEDSTTPRTHKLPYPL